MQGGVPPQLCLLVYNPINYWIYHDISTRSPNVKLELQTLNAIEQGHRIVVYIQLSAADGTQHEPGMYGILE